MRWLDYFLVYCGIGIVILLVMPPINRYLKKRVDFHRILTQGFHLKLTRQLSA